jgi:prepilin-type N-terminal cleavage/methylation domain-containing protein
MDAREVMTMSPIGSRRKSNRERKRLVCRGFTLIELILVMALLLVVLAVSAPQLQRFFKGRNLDSEARRFLSLTVYGQSRAISEGVPMMLWMNPRQGTYGLRAASGYVDVDTKAVEFTLDQNLRMEVTQPFQSTTLQPILSDRMIGNLPSIRFTPDGFIADGSPAEVLIIQEDKARQAEDDIVAAVQSTNRLRYELQPFNNSNRRGRR